VNRERLSEKVEQAGEEKGEGMGTIGNGWTTRWGNTMSLEADKSRQAESCLLE